MKNRPNEINPWARKRRRFSLAEKQQLVAATLKPGATVAVDFNNGKGTVILELNEFSAHDADIECGQCPNQLHGDTINFRNGYSSDAPEMLVEFRGMRRYGKGRSAYYAIRLGKVLRLMRWKRTRREGKNGSGLVSPREPLTIRMVAATKQFE